MTIFLRNRRKAAIALVLALSIAPGLTAGARAEAPPACQGADLVAKLKAENPDKYAGFEREARAVPNAEGLLWKIEAQGAEPSYLFGTMHTTDADLVTLSEPVRAALKDAQSVAVELAGANGPKAQAEMMAYVTRNALDMSGKGLEGLTTEQAAEVKRRIEAAGMPSAVASMLKPWFLGLTLQMSACELKRMSANLPTIDEAVENAGRANGATVTGLESVAEQLDAVSKISNETALRMIRDTVSTKAASDDLQATTLALYRDRRVGWYLAMKGDLFEGALDVSAYADFLEGIVDRRNVLMADRSKPLIDKGRAVIAVGALHLPGPKGLIELFRKQGYTLTRVW